MGRPTTFSSELAKKICDLLATGTTKKAAALGNGVAERTFMRWQDENPDFAEAIEEAEARAECNFTKTLTSAAAGKIVTKERVTVHKDGTQTIEREYLPADWRAAEVWLSRRRRADWGREIDLRKVSDAQLINMILAQQEPGKSPHEE